MNKAVIVLLLLNLFACIGYDIVDDRVPPRVSIKNPIDSLKVGDTYQFEAKFYDESGTESPALIIWRSTNNEVVSISIDGFATALQAGQTEIIARYQMAEDTLFLVCAANDVVESPKIRSANLTKVSSYPLEGIATLEEESDGSLYLRFSNGFKTTSSLPGLYVYLSNNVNSKANAYEVGAVTQFEGAQEYPLPGSISLNDYDFVLFYCKPFNVPVGNGEFVP